jgi:hypothetical protein
LKVGLKARLTAKGEIMIKGSTNGKASSEYVLALVGMIGGMVIASIEGFQGESSWLTLAGTLLSAICGASYTASRAKVKAALAGAEAVAQVGKQEANSPKD